MHRTWYDVPPNRIEGNFHPYPMHELERARTTLILGVRDLRSSDLRLKLGLKRHRMPGEPDSDDERPSKALLFGNSSINHSAGEGPNKAPSNSSNKHSAGEGSSKAPCVNNSTVSTVNDVVNAIPSWESLCVKSLKINASKILKCDSCALTMVSQEPELKNTIRDMTKHLHQAKHFSASQYCRNGARVLLGNMLVCANTEKFTRMTVLPVCPACCQVFPDIFMCSMHVKHIHKRGINGLHTLMKVIERHTVSFFATTCKSCQATFGTASELHKHWLSLPDHRPLQRLQQSSEIALYVCPTCTQFFSNFITCRMHFISSHAKKAENIHQVSGSVEVLFIQRPTPEDVCGLPMFNGQYPEQRKSIIKRLISFYTSTCVMKQSRALMTAILNP